MKKELIITILYAFAILFFSCKKNAQKTDIDSNSVKTIAISSIEESFQDISYFKDPQIVVLETLEESLFSEITRIFIDDNILFIYDEPSDNIFMFNITGKYISKIDCKGQGPREYTQINDFAIDTTKKQIILLCAIPQKRMYFTYDGVFVKEEKHPDYYASLTTDGNYIYFENRNFRTNNHQLHIIDTKTDEKQEGLEPINIENNFYIRGNSLSRGKKNLFVRRYDNSIYELANGKIRKKYHVDFKKHSFPDWLITAEDEKFISESGMDKYIFSISNAINNDHHMMFYTNKGMFVYDEKNDLLTGYKKMVNSKLSCFTEYTFLYYLPLENTNKIVCPIDDPSFIKHIAEEIPNHPNEMKKIRNKYPKLIEEIINLGNEIAEDNNPVLFIYEFKE